MFYFTFSAVLGILCAFAVWRGIGYLLLILSILTTPKEKPVQPAITQPIRVEGDPQATINSMVGLGFALGLCFIIWVAATLIACISK